MVNIIKQEIEMETALKNKIEFICSQSCRMIETNPQARVIINSKNINRKKSIK